MFLCFLEYVYGICYFIIHKMPENEAGGYMCVLRERVFSGNIMFFTGIVAGIGFVFSFFRFLFSKNRKFRFIALLLHALYLYGYMSYYLQVPATKIFTYISDLLGSVKLFFK